MSEDGGPVTTINQITFQAQASFVQAPVVDVLWVPGGEPEMLGKIMSDPASPYMAISLVVANPLNQLSRKSA